MSDTLPKTQAVIDDILASNNVAKMRDTIRVLQSHVDTLNDIIVTCRIRCERAERRLAEELRKKGELQP